MLKGVAFKFWRWRQPASLIPLLLFIWLLQACDELASQLHKFHNNSNRSSNFHRTVTPPEFSSFGNRTLLKRPQRIS